MSDAGRPWELPPLPSPTSSTMEDRTGTERGEGSRGRAEGMDGRTGLEGGRMTEGRGDEGVLLMIEWSRESSKEADVVWQARDWPPHSSKSLIPTDLPPHTLPPPSSICPSHPAIYPLYHQPPPHQSHQSSKHSDIPCPCPAVAPIRTS